MQTGFIQSEQFNLRYQIEGEGEVAIVVGSSIYYPRTFSKNLRNHLRIVFLDHRGFASASGVIHKESGSLDRVLDDIELIRKTLKLGRVMIIGHSGHGFMALEYAKKYLQYVLRVVLIGMGPSNNHENHLLSNHYLADSVCPERKSVLEENVKYLKQEIEDDPQKAFITYCLRLGARSWYDPHFDATPLWKDVIVNMPIIDHLWGEVFRDIDITNCLEVVDAPVLLALGKHDYLVAPFYVWDVLRPKFKNLTVRLFEKSSHTPQYEESEAFDDALLKWINQERLE